MKNIIVLLLVLLLATPHAEAALLSEQQVENVINLLGEKPAAGLKKVFENIDGAPGHLMIMAASVAAHEGNLEDAGFLFYAGLIRYKGDLHIFPTDNPLDPTGLLAALTDELGGHLTPTLLTDPVLYGKVIDRMEEWNPITAEGYAPGWEHHSPLSKKQAQTLLLDLKEEGLSNPRKLRELLKKSEYLKSIRIVFDKNLDSDNPEHAARHEAAIKTIEAMDQAAGITD